MAKIIKGGRHSDEAITNYSIFKPPAGRYAVRRSADPENYLHSGSKKVKRARETFAQAMINYSKTDIIKKQMYSEAVQWRVQWVEMEMMKRLLQKANNERKKRPPGALTAVGASDISWLRDYGLAERYNWELQENVIDWDAWIREHLPKKYYKGHEIVIPQEYSKQRMPNPSRSPLPHEIPTPEKDINKDRTPDQTPMYISVTIDPAGWTGFAYEGWIEVKSAYGTVKHWISSHKKETIIIVVMGVLAILTWELTIAGGAVTAGSEAIVNAEAATPAVVAALNALMIPWHKVHDWYYKRIILEWTEEMNIWAWNNDRAWQCYIDKQKWSGGVDFVIYQGPSEANKGEMAAVVHARVNFEEKTATLDWECLGGTDEIMIYHNTALLQICNRKGKPLDFVWLWNETTHDFGEARITVDWPKVTYAFEDRPVYGDRDFNDAFVIVTYDENLNPIGIRAIEGSHGDDLYIYWRGNLIAHFPSR